MIGLLGAKIVAYLGMAAGLVIAFFTLVATERRAGVKAQQAADVKGELADRKAADRVGQDVAALGDGEAVAALHSEFGRK